MPSLPRFASVNLKTRIHGMCLGAPHHAKRLNEAVQPRRPGAHKTPIKKRLTIPPVAVGHYLMI